jgi:hypothetical protein
MPHRTAALIIVDMQIGMQSAALPARNNPNAEDRIATLLAAWRSAALPVIHVRHISRTPQSVFSPGQIGAAFQDRFAPQAGEHVVEKNVPDAFIQSGLERWLHVRDIDALVIVGISTNHSVESTAHRRQPGLCNDSRRRRHLRLRPARLRRHRAQRRRRPPDVPGKHRPRIRLRTHHRRRHIRAQLIAQKPLPNN